MSKEKDLTPQAFRFSATSQEVRSLMVGEEPYFVAKDVCDVLELSDTSMALSKLDDDEKLTQKVFGSGQNRKMWLINESGLYGLILRSNKPEAKTFRKWVTKEVLPAIRRHGHYGSPRTGSDYLDARDVPFHTDLVNRAEVRFIDVDGDRWFSLNDLHRAFHRSTSSNQSAKVLNAKQRLAQKIWLFGNTHPAWFVNVQGAKLLMSRIAVGYPAAKLIDQAGKGGGL